MQLRPDGLAGALQRSIAPLIWVHGDEPLLQIEACDTVRRAARSAGFEERQVFDAGRGFKVDALVAEARSLSLFAASKLIELRTTGKPTRELGEALAEVASVLDDATRLLVSGPRLDRTTTQSAWFGALDRHAWFVAVYPVDRGQLPQWIAGRLGAQKQKADADTLRFLAERVEGNLLAAHQEIRKLGLLFPEGLLPGEEVRRAVLNVARYDARDLADAMLTGDPGRALRALDGLRAEGEAEPLVLWAVADAVRNLAWLAEARDRGQPVAQAMRELRIFSPRDRLYEQALRRVNTALLPGALQRAALTDRIVKGLSQGDAWAEMARIATTVAGAPSPDGQ
jgi:DNA polymerase-3 subunit delta